MRSIMAGMIGALIVVVAFVLGAQWERSQGSATHERWPGTLLSGNASAVRDEFELHSEYGLNILFNKSSGAAWRYYREMEQGKLVSEGFVQLRFINTSDISDAAAKAKTSPPIGSDFEPEPTATPAHPGRGVLPKPTSSPEWTPPASDEILQPAPSRFSPPPSNRIKPSPQPTR